MTVVPKGRCFLQICPRIVMMSKPQGITDTQIFAGLLQNVWTVLRTYLCLVIMNISAFGSSLGIISDGRLLAAQVGLQVSIR